MNIKRWIRFFALSLALLATGAAVGAAPVQAGAKPLTVYLSPSAQPWNPYWDGSGSEEFWMRLVAECMKPELARYGVSCTVAAKRPEGSREVTGFLTARAQEAERLGADLYVAIHSNASPAGQSRKGTELYVHSGDAEGMRFAQLVSKHFPYPDKSLISFQQNDALLELSKPAMPRLLVETAYHDRADDGAWLEQSVPQIAHGLAAAIAEYGGFTPATGWEAPQPIALSSSALTLKPGQTAILTAAAPSYAVWSSGYEEVAAVNAGQITAKKLGTSMVAVCADGRVGFCLVTVTG